MAHYLSSTRTRGGGVKDPLWARQEPFKDSEQEVQGGQGLESKDEDKDASESKN